MLRIYKFSLFFALITTVSLGFFTTLAYADSYGQWGANNASSAGSIQTVPEGYGLTAIGYGSDDKKCRIRIKTAPINVDGSIGLQDWLWTDTYCSGGAPGTDRTTLAKFFEPTDGDVVTGWTWGASTSGGKPGNDGSPPDECFYQEYINLATKLSGYEYNGSCANRGYNVPGDLKAIARAPAGRVIVGIGFNLDDDADLTFLAMTTRTVRTAGLDVSTLQVNLNPSDTSQTVTISNVNATNGGSFTVDCFYYEQNLSPNNISIQCPRDQIITSTNTASLPITVTGSLPPGTYTGNIDIVATGVNGTIITPPSSKTIAVSYTVPPTSTPIPPLSCEAQPGPNPVLTNTNTTFTASGGSGTYLWSGGGSPATGSNSSTFTTQYATPGPKTVTVTRGSASTNCNLTVNPPGSLPVATISLSPASLNFSATQGSNPSSSQSISIKNTGSATLNWSALSSQNWLSLTTPSSRSIAPGDSQTITANVFSSALAAGTYTATITVSDTSASNSPQSVSVTLVVSGSGVANTGITLTANPATIDSGGASALTWRISDYDWNRGSCALGTWNGTTFTFSEIQTISRNQASGSRSISDIFDSTTYRVRCPNSSTASYDDVTVTVRGGSSTPSAGPLWVATDGDYVCDEPATNEDGETYCPNPMRLAGSWQSSLSVTDPALDNKIVDFKYDFGRSWYGVANRVDFDCTSDGTVDGSVSQNSSNWNLTQIPIFNICNYPTPGTYTATARTDAGVTGAINITVNAPPICPVASVILSSNTVNVGGTVIASAPAGFSGGTFAYSRRNAREKNVSISPSGDTATITGRAVGTTVISGSGWNNTNGTTGCSLTGTTLNVTSAPLPDLTAGNPTVSFTDSSRTAVSSIAGLVKNISNTNTSASFPNLLQIDLNSNNSVDQEMNKSHTTSLPSNTNATLTFSGGALSILPAGTHTARICADLDISSVGSRINESNENNNCGAWVPFTINGSFNYSLSNSGTSNVTKTSGDAFTQNTITKTRVAGTAQPITLSLSGIPNGTSYLISNSSCSPTCSSAITFTVRSNTLAGTYPITVTGSPLGRQTTFNLVVSGNPMTVSCVPSSGTALVNQQVIWTTNTSGGTSPFTYSWSGTNIPANPAPSSNPYRITYSTVGQKNASVRVTDSDGLSATCPTSTVQVNFNPDFEEF